MPEDKPAQARSAPLAGTTAGLLVGTVVSVTVQPLDVIRTRLQADAARYVRTSTLQATASIYRNHGIRGFWHGTGPTVWRLTLGLGLQFCALEVLKGQLLALRPTVPRMPGRLTAGESFWVGGLARGLAAVATCPVTVVKTQMEYAGYGTKHQSTLSALMTIARKERLPGLYRGLVPTVAANAPFSALYLMFYTSLRQRLSQGETPSPGINFASGAVASIAATLITQPADLVRTHSQLGMIKALAPGIRPLWGIRTLQDLVKAQGFSVLLAGSLPRVMKRSLQSALVWTMYEELQPRLARAYRGSEQGN